MMYNILGGENMEIYIITNNINGKIYIGQTVNTAKERFEDHCRHKDTVIDKAIKKYGKENFTVETICEADTIEELNELEKYYIRLADSMNPSIGYNMCEGGGNTKGYHHSDESKKKMTASRIGIFAGEKNPFYGKHHSQEQIEKWKRERKGRKLTEEWKANVGKAAWKPVINITTGERFSSIKEAAEHYGILATHISRVCRGKRKHCGGYEFAYDNTVPSLDNKEGVTTIP